MVIADVVFGEGFSEEMAFRLSPERGGGGSLAKSPENSIPGTGNSMHGGPEMGEGLCVFKEPRVGPHG